MFFPFSVVKGDGVMRAKFLSLCSYCQYCCVLV